MQEKQTQKQCQNSSYFAEVFRVRRSAQQAPEKDSEIREALSSLSLPAWLKPGSLSICYLKMYPVCLTIHGARPTRQSSTRWTDWGMVWNGKEEYAAMKKTEREAVWMQVDARMGEVLADAPALQGFLDFMSQCRNSLPNQLLLSGQNADITDARTFQQWKDAGRHIRTGEEGYTAIIGQVYENNGRKASGYNIGKVFDITQTRGRPVPPPAEYQVDELIAATIESSPVPIQISDSLPDGIQAQYVPKNRTIYVRNGMDAGTTLCAIVRECAQADFHKDYTYNRQAYAALSYCAAYMVAHRYGLDTTAFNFDRVVALYGNLGKEQQRGFLSDVNTVGGGLLRSLSRTLAVQTRELLAAEYAVAVPSAKKQSRQQERG